MCLMKDSTEDICAYPECPRLRYAVTTGFCRTHHTRSRLGTEMSKPVRGDRTPCAHGGCPLLSTAKGYCTRHYKQWNRTGNTADIVYEGPTVCVVQNCKRPIVNLSAALCQRHAASKSVRPLKGDRHHWVPCPVPRCDQNMHPQGSVCRNHRARAAQYGLSPEEFGSLMSVGGCEACGSDVALVVHHDHVCCPRSASCGDCVIGVLCSPCNRAAGFVGDDPDRLEKLAVAVRLKPWRERSKSRIS